MVEYVYKALVLEIEVFENMVHDLILKLLYEYMLRMYLQC